MSDEPVNVLRELARRFGKRLSRCKVYDANVCTSRAVPERPWEFVTVAGEPFSHELLYIYRDRKVRLFANQMYVNGVVKGTFATGVLTINAKERIGFRSEYATTLVVNGKEYPAFTETGTLSPVQDKLLRSPQLLVLAKDSDLQESESLHFTNGDVSFYLKRPTLSRVMNSIDRIIDLAQQIETTGEELNLTLLPAQFHRLNPLIRKWAEGDDSDRQDLLANSSRAALHGLVDGVEPYLSSIDSYLDSFGDRPPSEEAAALGRLAECVAEARLHLNKQKRSRVK